MIKDIEVIWIKDKVDSIAVQIDSDWHNVPFEDETHPLTQELRKWEATNYVVIPPFNKAQKSQLIEPDWQKLTTDLRGTELFAKTYMAAKTDLLVAIPFNLLLSTVNSANPSLSDLEFALIDIRTEMGERLSKEDLSFANKVLADSFFTIQL